MLFLWPCIEKNYTNIKRNNTEITKIKTKALISPFEVVLLTKKSMFTENNKNINICLKSSKIWRMKHKKEIF